jgi:peptidoglycan/LPS O-acetylase OafA/YrhL
MQRHTELPYLPSLDGVRGLSVLIIMGVHLGLPGVTGGYLAVDLFFALSGFLITRQLIHEWHCGRVSLRRFYTRRAFRLFPALILLIAGLAAYAHHELSPAVTGEIDRTAAYSLAYVMNIAWASGWVTASSLSHLWTLSVEEQFYVLWPALLMLALASRRPRSSAVVLATVLATASVAWRAYRMATHPDLRAYIIIDTRADGLLFGCLGAMMLAWMPAPIAGRRGQLLMRAAFVAAASYLGWRVVVPSPATYLPWGLTWFGLACATFVVGAVAAPMRIVDRLLQIPVLAWTGRRSYGLYLWHLPLFLLPLPYLGDAAHPSWANPATFAARIVLAFLAAGLSFALVEQPVLALRKRVGRSRASRLARDHDVLQARPALAPAPPAVMNRFDDLETVAAVHVADI